MTVELDALVVPAFDDLAGLPGEARPWREGYDLDERIAVEGVPRPVRHGDGLGPYRATEMEDAGTAAALARFDRLAEYLSIRAISNHDRPAPETPPRESFFSSAFEEGFEPAVKNAVAVARAVVDDRLG